MFSLFQSDLMPHGFCIKWSSDLLSFYVVSDALIFFAYTYIGISLILFAKSHKELEWNMLLWLFAAFILACGVTHLMDIVTFWLPFYWVDATLKGITAIVSVGTVLYLAPRLSMLLNIHSHAEFELVNEEKKLREDELIIEKHERREIEFLKQTYFEHHFAIDKAAIFAETDSEGVITFVNEHFCRISGYSKDELIGSTYGLIKSDMHPPEFYEKLWETVQSGNVWCDELCNRHKNGLLYWVNAVIVPIIDAGELSPKKYITIRFDITDRKEAEQRQIELTKQVNQMQKMESLSRLTSGIAHDFNNILAAIMGYNQLNNFVGEDCTDEKLKEEILFNTEQVNIASERAVNLIKKMMAYSRQNLINKHIEVKPTDELIEEVLSMVRPALTSIYQLNTDVDSELIIQIDSNELHQILTNLIVNARDAMKQGGKITISLKQINIRKRELICNSCAQKLEGNFIELSVADNGTGIEKGVITHIFDPFFTTKEVGEGTGLGLSTVSGMVHEARGHIIVESKTTAPNTGTTFRLLFPLVNAA
jgi:PAS domain S-box-containing protein